MKNLIIGTALFYLMAIPANAAEKNTLGLFLGATHAQSETEFTYGVEYEYKFDKRWGAGVVFEKIDDAHHGDGVTVQLAAMYYHPLSNIKLGLGVGKEKVSGDHYISETLYRVSAAYDFHFNHIELAPTVALDFIDGETTTVFGVALATSF